MRISDWSSDVCSSDLWKGQGRPDYIESVTEEPEDGGFAMEGAPAGGDSAEDRMYAKACQIVTESQKASTSRSEEHTSELRSLMRTSYAVFCLKKKNKTSIKSINKTNPH